MAVQLVPLSETLLLQAGQKARRGTLLSRNIVISVSLLIGVGLLKASDAWVSLRAQGSGIDMAMARVAWKPAPALYNRRATQFCSRRLSTQAAALNKAVSPEIDEQIKAFDMSTVTFPIVATCELAPEGKPCGGGAEESPGCKGKCILTQLDADTIKIDWEFSGVTPSESGLHGFHIHETSDFSNGCTSAGPHYNPFNKLHGAKEDEERHAGGLGNIKIEADGTSKGSMTDHLVKIYGPTTCVGRSVMLHAKEDDLGLGDNSKAHLGPPWQDGFVSKITGNAGARIACGEIILEGK